MWLLPSLASKRISRVTTADYQACIDAAAVKGLSRRTCVNIRLAINTFRNFCADSDWQVSDIHELKIPPIAPTGERNILQPSQIDILFSDPNIMHYGKPVHARNIYAWRFIVTTGLRRGELCGLQLDDFDPKGQYVTIRRSINSLDITTQGKTINAHRRVMLGAEALQALNDEFAMLKSEGIVSKWLFPDKDGNSLDSNSLYKTWLTYRKQHGIVSNLHELRHTFVSVVSVNAPIKLLKSQVGHSDDTDTGNYMHAVSGEGKIMVNAINESFQRDKPEK